MFSLSDVESNSQFLRAPRLVLFHEEGCSYAEVESWGEIENIRLLPLDRLIIHKLNEIDIAPEYSSGELLLLKPIGYGHVILGRKYGEHILMEPFGKPVSMDQWGIVGAVLAIERPLGLASPMGVPGHLALYNAPQRYDEHIQEEYVCDPMYVEELSRCLLKEAPTASCVVATDVCFLHKLLAQVPEGKLWISPTTEESVPNFFQEWQLMSKRKQRKDWIRRHRPNNQHHKHLPVIQQELSEEEMLASK